MNTKEVEEMFGKELVWEMNLCIQILEQDVLDDSRDDFSSEKVKQFVKCVRNFSKVHTEAFILCMLSGRVESAMHFFRLLSDCGLRLYAATLFKGKRLERYMDKFFAGKEPKDTKYKGRELTTGYIKELIRQEIAQEANATEPHWLELFLFTQEETNPTVHLSRFYLNSDSEKLTEELKKDIIGSYTQLLVFLASLINRLNIQ